MSHDDRPIRNIEHLLRELAPQVLGALARRHDAFDLAEDATQEALIAASTQWPRDGVPDNPRGWLYQVAQRRLMDALRSAVSRRRREEALIAAITDKSTTIDEAFASEHDDSLILLFMCCHPSLSSASAIALTLRAVGGLTTAEIAHAFFVPEATMAQRISRAKQTIKQSQVAFVLPSESERTARLRAVMHVLYLIFNEGYTSTAGPALHRTDLTNEAIRLTRLLKHQLPADPEVAGLLALMLLTDARRAARTGQSGELIPLDEQDRSQWNRAFIAEGVAMVSDAFSRGAVGPYQLQAAVAAVHDEAAHANDTDWPQILALYTVLMELSDSPMVVLSHAIAWAMVHGERAGLERLQALDSDARFRGHYRLAAARAHLYERLGDFSPAARHFREAADGTASLPERDYLTLKAARATEQIAVDTH